MTILRHEQQPWALLALSTGNLVNEYNEDISDKLLRKSSQCQNTSRPYIWSRVQELKTE